MAAPTNHHARSRRGRRRAAARQRLPLGAAIVATVMVIVAMVSTASVLPQLAQGAPRPGRATPLAGATTGPATAPAPSTVGPTPAAPTPTAPAPAPAVEPVLRLAGRVPPRGSGTFVHAPGPGPVLGPAGTLSRFRVAVEDGSGADPAEFAASVDATLGDPRGWTADRRTRLQRVPDGAAADFTVLLATADTAGRLCLAGGIDIRVGGRPYTSCRLPGKVVVNLDRWRLSVPEYVGAGVPLTDYRHYVVNHEVGHQLGHGHERCPGPGRPAPVMVQQTLSLQGCAPYAWPTRDGRRYTGPAA